MNEASHLRELSKRTDRICLLRSHSSFRLLHTADFSSYLSTDIMPYHLLDHHVSERLEVLDELLVLVVSGLLLDEELEEGSLLPADPGHVGRFLSHPEQQPQQISHA